MLTTTVIHYQLSNYTTFVLLVQRTSCALLSRALVLDHLYNTIGGAPLPQHG